MAKNKEEIILKIAIGDLLNGQINNIVILEDNKKNLIKLLNEDLVYRVPRNLLTNSKIVLNLYPDETDLYNVNDWLDLETLEEGEIIKTKEVKVKDELES